MIKDCSFETRLEIYQVGGSVKATYTTKRGDVASIVLEMLDIDAKDVPIEDKIYTRQLIGYNTEWGQDKMELLKSLPVVKSLIHLNEFQLKIFIKRISYKSD
jgi:hypothetical protein